MKPNEIAHVRDYNSNKETLTDMQYTTSKKIGHNKAIQVSIRFDDKCNNGHHDFSITGMIGIKGRANYDTFICEGDEYKINECGCIHDQILKYYPEFQIFVDLHLSNKNGQPLYAVANGFYNLKNSSKETTLSYLRISEDEYSMLSHMDGKDDFGACLDHLGVLVRWKKEASKAFNQLKELTGITDYTFTETKPNSFECREDYRNEFVTKLTSGYFSPENVERRKNEAKEAEKLRKIEELKTTYNQKVEEMNLDLNIKIQLIGLGCESDNFIYYSSSNTLVFNWKGYGSTVPESEIDYYRENFDYSELPENFKISVK